MAKNKTSDWGRYLIRTGIMDENGQIVWLRNNFTLGRDQPFRITYTHTEPEKGYNPVVHVYSEIDFSDMEKPPSGEYYYVTSYPKYISDSAYGPIYVGNEDIFLSPGLPVIQLVRKVEGG